MRVGNFFFLSLSEYLNDPLRVKNESYPRFCLSHLLEKKWKIQVISEWFKSTCWVSAATSSEDFLPVFFIQVKHLLKAMVSWNDLQSQQSVCYKTSVVSTEEKSRCFTTLK